MTYFAITALILLLVISLVLLTDYAADIDRPRDHAPDVGQKVGIPHPERLAMSGAVHGPVTSKKKV